MGGHDWSLQLHGPNLKNVFEAAAEQDRHEHGSDGYSGEIGQAGGVSYATDQVCHPDEASYLAHELAGFYTDDETGRKRAQQIASRLGITLRAESSAGRNDFYYSPDDSLPVAQKWCGAYAIPTAAASAFTLTERAVPLDVTTLGQHSFYPNERVLALLHEKLTEQLGAAPRIAKVEVLDDTPKYRTAVRATDGAVVTRYRVYRRNGHSLVPEPGKPHPSMAAARAAIVELLKRPVDDRYGYGGEVEYVALGEKVREDGSPLVVGTRELVSRYIAYKVTLVKTPKTPPPVTGWLVYGVAGD